MLVFILYNLIQIYLFFVLKYYFKWLYYLINGNVDFRIIEKLKEEINIIRVY